MTLRELVQEYRKEHNLSQRQFASLCNLSNGYISMIEKNLNPKTKLPVTPSIPALKKIATGMGMNLTELLSIADDMTVDMSATDTTEDSLFSVSNNLFNHNTSDLQLLSDALDQLNEEGREKLLDYAADLVASGRYIKSDSVGLGQTEA